MADLRKLAERFVVFEREWMLKKESGILVDSDAKMLTALLNAAGFEVERVEIGVLNVHDYGLRSRMMPINVSCPFRAKEGRVTYVATSWLNQLWELVASSQDGESTTSAVEMVEKEIARSVPLTPIPIGPDGEEFIEFEPNCYGFLHAEHVRDNGLLTYGPIGKHKYCTGSIKRIHVSEGYDALTCERCNLRVTFPRSIVEGNVRRVVLTFGDLRFAMARLKRNGWRWTKE